MFPAASGSTDVPGTEEMVSVMVARGGDGGEAPATSHQVSSQHCDTGDRGSSRCGGRVFVPGRSRRQQRPTVSKYLGLIGRDAVGIILR